MIMKLMKFILAIMFFAFNFGANAQMRYESEMSKFLGTWVESKSIDYDGRLKVVITKDDGEIFVKAVLQFPDDLPTNRVTIPIESVSYKNGTIVTFGQIRRIDAQPTFKLIIEYDDGRLKVSEYGGTKGKQLEFRSSHYLDID